MEITREPPSTFSYHQARNQLGRRVFWEESKILNYVQLFWEGSKILNYVQHIFPGWAKKILRGVWPPVSPWLRACVPLLVRVPQIGNPCSTQSTVNCTSAISYNCDATITFFCTTMNNRWRTNYQYFFFGCTQPPVQLTGLLGVWMRYGDLKIFIMTHQHTEARNNFPWKTKNPHGTLKTHGTSRHVLRNTRVRRNPVEEHWSIQNPYGHIHHGHNCELQINKSI